MCLLFCDDGISFIRRNIWLVPIGVADVDVMNFDVSAREDKRGKLDGNRGKDLGLRANLVRGFDVQKCSRERLAKPVMVVVRHSTKSFWVYVVPVGVMLRRQQVLYISTFCCTIASSTATAMTRVMSFQCMSDN